MWTSFYEFLTREESLHTPPLPHGYPYYILVETLGSEPQEDLERFETVLGEAMEQALVVDAVIAKSQAERQAIWEIRDDVLEFFTLGPSAIFDISLTMDRMPGFVDDVDRFMSQVENPINIVFGHLGDGNLHLTLGSRDAGAFDREAIEHGVYSLVEKHRGSISAEHGVGVMKRDHLSCSRTPQELDLMYAIKRTLDPNNILNPDKIFLSDNLLLKK
jgi:FAD/FMN-containing dehydrogenase